MKHIAINFVLLLLFFISTINKIQCLCVLESDFGFSINCNFKKSGMFRVRNLGGLKAHFGLGFSLGDELGFPDSIGNVEGSKKRSLDLRAVGNGNAVRIVAPEKIPVMPVQKPRAIRPIATVSPLHLSQIRTMPMPRAFAPQAVPQGFKTQSMTEVKFLPLGAPRFKKMPEDVSKAKDNVPKAQPSYSVAFASNRVSSSIPEFQSLPLSTSEKFETLTKVETFPNEDLPQVDLKGHTIEELAAVANVSVEVIKSAIKLRQQQLMVEKKVQQQKQPVYNHQTVEPSTVQETLPSTVSEKTTKSTTLPTTIIATTAAKTKSTSSYTAKKNIKKHPLSGGHKVMNAPKEYYPVGYEKNFDDNFKTKVDLPATSFHCGDQKHFPGLYADQDLGCMVFHVCALTDDGLVMKSFLCPESTLFDQTILKCNWWFYTDCKSSKSLYDSNLPVSKSYQLMKSLSFFTKHYKNSTNGTLELANHNIEENDVSNNIMIVTPKDSQ